MIGGSILYPYFAFQWHITDECDQRCQHCYIFSEKNNICLKSVVYEDMEKVVASCMEMCVKLKRTPYFYITGGDPILHKDFWMLCMLLKKQSIDFGILGNPFHLNDDVCNWLVHYGCKKYQLSLDGMRETHDLFRKPGSFYTTLEKISCIQKAGMYCAIMSTVSCKNINEFPELIDTVVAHHADVFTFGRYCPTSEQKSEEYHIEPLAYQAFLDKIWSKYAEYKDCDTTFQLKDHLWTLYLYEKNIFNLPAGMDCDTIYDGCHCGSDHITILPSGDVFACRRMNSKIGNVFEASMYDLFTGHELDCYRDYKKFEKCSRCELFQLCRGCPAVAFGYTGNMYAPDPQCWKEVKADA